MADVGSFRRFTFIITRDWVKGGGREKLGKRSGNSRKSVSCCEWSGAADWLPDDEGLFYGVVEWGCCVVTIRGMKVNSNSRSSEKGDSRFVDRRQPTELCVSLCRSNCNGTGLKFVTAEEEYPPPLQICCLREYFRGRSRTKINWDVFPKINSVSCCCLILHCPLQLIGRG